MIESKTEGKKNVWEENRDKMQREKKYKKEDIEDRKNRDKQEDKKQRRGVKNCRIDWPAWCIIGIVLLSSLPLFTDYCIGGKELAFHLRRIEELKNTLQAGRFAMREGSPFLMIPAAFRMLGMSVQTAYKSCLFLINLITAWISYLCFSRMFQDRVIGVLGSMLYTWLPYRFDLLYCRAALGEIAALSFLPVVLYGIYRIYKGDTEEKRYQYVWILPALGFTCMAQANILTFLLAVGFTFLVCVLYLVGAVRRLVLSGSFAGRGANAHPAVKDKDFQFKRRFFALCKMALGFVLVNFFYLFPVLRSLGTEQESLWRNVGFIQEKGLYPTHYLWIFFRYGQTESFAEGGMAGTEPLGVGFAVTICIFTLLWLLFTGRRGEEKADALWNTGGTFAIIGIVLLWMSTSSFPWDNLRSRGGLFLRFVTLLQSPAKLVALVGLIAVFLSCLAAREIKRRFPKGWKYCLAAVMLIALVTTQFLADDILLSNGRLDIITAEDIPEITAVGSEYLP